MQIIICGPAIPEEAEMMIPGASPAAAKYLRNMSNALQKKGLKVIMFSYITAKLPDSARTIIESCDDGNHYFIKGENLVKSMAAFRNDFLSFIDVKDIVIFYNMGYAAWGFVDAVKRCGIKNVLILADHTGVDECKNFIRKLMAKKTESEYRKFDKAILLSDKAHTLLAKSCDSIVVEGGIDLKVFRNFSLPNSNRKKILYSGMLSAVTGVDILLASFTRIESKDVILIITGKGELGDEVTNAMKKDPRIRFMGFISNEDYYRVLNESDIVVNPRNMAWEQNKNNFPSKVLEYLASGRIVVSTKFPGYNKFQQNFLFCDSSVDALTETLKKALMINDDDKQTIYVNNRAKANDYDWDTQVERILDFIED
jgi:glycosyltransferase involved in cell wall biosynthesis